MRVLSEVWGVALRVLSLVSVAAIASCDLTNFPKAQRGSVMSLLNSSMMLAMLPANGGLKLEWEKKSPQNGNQVIELKISPDHLQACKDRGMCVDGCPSREFYFVGHLLIRR